MNKSKGTKQATLFQSWGGKIKEVDNDNASNTNVQPSTLKETDNAVIDLCDSFDDEDDGILFQAEESIHFGVHGNDTGNQEGASFFPGLQNEEALGNISIGADGFTLTQGQTQASGLPGFDRCAGKLWIYPTNYPVRDYQYNIVQQALFKNTMVTLPTGLGKTFIAAVVMYNFYRWYPQGKVIFMAPTKPLVAQQIEACYNIMGIPQDHTAEMTGSMGPPKREKAWHEKRVFFLTPQVLTNDLSRGSCPAVEIKCLVIDEAHKALGNHAYCQVVRELIKYTENFRILSLSATPGSDIKAVQQVLNNLLISHIEIRTEESIDIKQYSHERKVDKVVVPLGDELSKVKVKYIQIMDVVVNKLKKHGVLYNRDTTSLSKFLILKSREAFRQNPPERLQRSQYGIVEGDFALAMSLYHGFELLQLHGSRSLYNFLNGIMTGDKSYGRTRTELMRNSDFTELMEMLSYKYRVTPSQTGDAGNPKPFVIGHPKMEKLQEIVLEHFNRVKDVTRVMIFSQYRDSVQEITDMLHVHWPMVKVMSFIGQASAGKNTKGFTQKEQLKVMKQFREGGYNTLVSTCVGEEGLDIGDVDLIICFDAHKSPIRLVQRMGRTGRKREGKIVMLVTQGKEEQIYNQSQYSKKSIHKAILNGAKSLHFYQHSARMVPEGVDPVAHKMHITLKENFKPTRKITTDRIPGDQGKITSMLVTNKKDEPHEIITLEEYKELVPWLVPGEDIPKLPSSDCTCLSRDGEQHRDEDEEPVSSAGTFLSLSEWSPWQNTLQDTEAMDHSLGTRHLVQLMEFIQLQQSLDPADDAYGLEMAAYLNEDDILKPGEIDSTDGSILKFCVPQTSCNPAKERSSIGKGKKKLLNKKIRHRDTLSNLHILEEDCENDSDDDLPAFDLGNKNTEKHVMGSKSEVDKCKNGLENEHFEVTEMEFRDEVDGEKKIDCHAVMNTSEEEQDRTVAKKGVNGSKESLKVKVKNAITSKAKAMEFKINENKDRKRKKKRHTSGLSRTIVEVIADTDCNDFDNEIPGKSTETKTDMYNKTYTEKSREENDLEIDMIHSGKGIESVEQMLLKEGSVSISNSDKIMSERIYMVRTPPQVDDAVIICEAVGKEFENAKLDLVELVEEWQRENENGKYLLIPNEHKLDLSVKTPKSSRDKLRKMSAPLCDMKIDTTAVSHIQNCSEDDSGGADDLAEYVQSEDMDDFDNSHERNAISSEDFTERVHGETSFMASTTKNKSLFNSLTKIPQTGDVGNEEKFNKEIFINNENKFDRSLKSKSKSTAIEEFENNDTILTKYDTMKEIPKEDFEFMISGTFEIGVDLLESNTSSDDEILNISCMKPDQSCNSKNKSNTFNSGHNEDLLNSNENETKTTMFPNTMQASFSKRSNEKRKYSASKLKKSLVSGLELDSPSKKNMTIPFSDGCEQVTNIKTVELKPQNWNSTRVPFSSLPLKNTNNELRLADDVDDDLFTAVKTPTPASVKHDNSTQFTFTQAMACVNSGSMGSGSESLDESKSVSADSLHSKSKNKVASNNDDPVSKCLFKDSANINEQSTVDRNRFYKNSASYQKNQSFEFEMNTDENCLEESQVPEDENDPFPQDFSVSVIQRNDSIFKDKETLNTSNEKIEEAKDATNLPKTYRKNSASSDDVIDLPEFDLGFDLDDVDIIPPSPQMSQKSSRLSQTFTSRLSQGRFTSSDKSCMKNTNAVFEMHENTDSDTLQKAKESIQTFPKSKRSLNMKKLSNTKPKQKYEEKGTFIHDETGVNTKDTGIEKNSHADLKDLRAKEKCHLDIIPELEMSSFLDDQENFETHDPGRKSEKCENNSSLHDKSYPNGKYIETRDQRLRQENKTNVSNGNDNDVIPDFNNKLEKEATCTFETSFNLFEDDLDEWIDSGVEEVHVTHIGSKNNSKSGQHSKNIAEDRDVSKAIAKNANTPVATICPMNLSLDSDSVKRMTENEKVNKNEISNTITQSVKNINKHITSRQSIFKIDDLSPDCFEDSFNFDTNEIHDISKLGTPYNSDKWLPRNTSTSTPVIAPSRKIQTVTPMRNTGTTQVNKKTPLRNVDTPVNSKLDRNESTLRQTTENKEETDNDDSFIIRRKKKSLIIDSSESEQENLDISQNSADLSARDTTHSGAISNKNKEERKRNRSKKVNFISSDDDDFDDSILLNKNAYIQKKKILIEDIDSDDDDDFEESIMQPKSIRSKTTLIKNVKTDKVSSFKHTNKCNKSTENDIYSKRIQNDNLKAKCMVKGKRTSNPFIDEEAELSGEDSENGSDDEDEDVNLDVYEGSFIQDSQCSQSELMDHTDMQALYMKSVRSPIAGRGGYKLQYEYKNVDVFSQVPQENESEYMEDSFCVGSEEDFDWLGEVEGEEDPREITLVHSDATIMQTGRKRKRGVVKNFETGRQRAIHSGRMRALDEIRSKLMNKNVKKLSKQTNVNPLLNNQEISKNIRKRSRIQMLQDDTSSDEEETVKLNDTDIKSPNVQLPNHRKKRARLIMSSDDEDEELDVQMSRTTSDDFNGITNLKIVPSENGSCDTNRSAGRNTTNQKTPEELKKERLTRQRLLQEEFRKRNQQSEIVKQTGNKNTEKPVETSISSCFKSSNSMTKIKDQHKPMQNVSVNSKPDLRSSPDPKLTITNKNSDTEILLETSSHRSVNLGKPVMLVDSREVSGSQDIISDLRFKFNLNISAAQLPGCDYIISNRMAVERKQWSEFSNGANRTKLIERMQHLNELYDRPCLIVEKDRVKPGEEKSARPMHWTKYVDRTLALLLRTHTKILFTDTQAETAALLADLCLLEQRKNMGITAKVDLGELKQNLVKFYVSIPKLSYIHALNLCEGYSSMSEFLNSSTKVIERKGKMSANRAIDVFNYIKRQFDSNMLPTNYK